MATSCKVGAKHFEVNNGNYRLFGSNQRKNYVDADHTMNSMMVVNLA